MTPEQMLKHQNLSKKTTPTIREVGPSRVLRYPPDLPSPGKTILVDGPDGVAYKIITPDGRLVGVDDWWEY